MRACVRACSVLFVSLQCRDRAAQRRAEESSVDFALTIEHDLEKRTLGVADNLGGHAVLESNRLPSLHVAICHTG